jgi:nucleoside-diphosphate-sugar epimerase
VKPTPAATDARGHYSRSKLAADRVALYEARHGAPVVVLRPGLLYGPERRPPLARQSFNVAGLKLILVNANYRLPLAYVDNVADAVLLALRCDDAVGKAFTIVDENVRRRRALAPGVSAGRHDRARRVGARAGLAGGETALRPSPTIRCGGRSAGARP